MSMPEYLRHQMENHDLTPFVDIYNEPLGITVFASVKDKHGDVFKVTGIGSTYELAVEDFCEKLRRIGQGELS